MTAFAKAAGCAAALGLLVVLSGIVPGAEAPAAKAEAGDISKSSTVTLDVKEAKLAAVLAEIATQSGNKAITVDAGVAPKPVTVKLDKTPYWEALDKLCAQQALAYRTDEATGELMLVAAPGEPAKTTYAGPVVFKLASVSPAAQEDGAWAAGKLKCTVNFFWEDRLTPSAFKPAKLQKLTDAAGNPCELPAGATVKVGKTSTSGPTPMGRLEVMGGASSGTFIFLTPRPAAGGAFAEISGTFGLVASAGKIELRIENALVGGEQSVEREGYKLTITKVEVRGDTATVTTSFTKDGNPVELPWPGRGGWSLVDADGKITEGRLMGGSMAMFRLPAEAKGEFALVRTYSPDAAEVTYLFKFAQVPIPK